jgi:hypothetical protein
METRENWVKTIVVATVVAVLLGVGFAAGFSFLVRTFLHDEEATFLNVLPFGLGFGILMISIGLFLRLVRYKLITESMTFEDKTAFLVTLEKAIGKIEYRPKTEEGDLWIFECDSDDLDTLIKRNIAVKFEGNGATLAGPKASLKKLQEALQTLSLVA